MTVIELCEPGIVCDPTTIETLDLAKSPRQWEASQQDLGKGDQMAGTVSRPTEAELSGQFSKTIMSCLEIEPQGVGQENRIEGAVMGSTFRAKRMGEGMDDPKPFVQADPPEQGTHHQGASSRAI